MYSKGMLPKGIDFENSLCRITDLSPAEIKAAGSTPVIAPDNKRLTLETGQSKPEPVPEVPRKKTR